MPNAVEELLRIQRKIDVLTRFLELPAQAPVQQPTNVAAQDMAKQLEQLYEELAAAQQRAVPALKQRREFSTAVAAGSSGSRGGAGGLPSLKVPGSADVEMLVDLRMPSVATGLARLFALDRTPLLTVRLLNRGSKPRKLCVASSVEGFTAHALETVLCSPDEQQCVDQFPTFFPDAVARLDEFCVATVRVDVTDLDSGVTIACRTLPLRLLARQTAVLYQLDPQAGTYRDLRHTLGAWITPNARAVHELLRSAADLSSLKAMSGYQVDEAGVLEHVRAIFEALKAAKIVYVNSVDAFGGVEGQFLQRVRTPTESLACKSANCIDGTVLMASLLEATGIEAGVVLVPGHAYLAWLRHKPEGTHAELCQELSNPGDHLERWEWLETTLIGTSSFEAACEHARHATERFRRAKLLTILPVATLRQRNVTPLE